MFGEPVTPPGQKLKELPHESLSSLLAVRRSGLLPERHHHRLNRRLDDGLRRKLCK
jgi:hypothetical protein